MSRRLALLLVLLLPAPLLAQPLALPMQDELAAIDIEPPLPLPEQKPLWPIAAGAGLLLGGVLLFVVLRRKKTQPQPAPQAHETALLALTQADALIAKKDCAAFAALFDQTLRRYLEQRFGIDASRQTAGELICFLADPEEEQLKAYAESLQNWLAFCEAAKFAGAALNEADMAELTAQLRAFVEATKNALPCAATPR
ncbi:LPXTG cell wall anchor domain-containing protein [Candidatus Electronema sp. TJ]|uniref:LPXTG cell wall anchor domain-containing protein n=1 Tax=Candidatus Electronema sp. TJ TaxID=3401573 RepID=UPI003AA99D6D